jgi:hypothetical protein
VFKEYTFQKEAISTTNRFYNVMQINCIISACYLHELGKLTYNRQVESVSFFERCFVSEITNRIILEGYFNMCEIKVDFVCIDPL